MDTNNYRIIWVQKLPEITDITDNLTYYKWARPYHTSEQTATVRKEK